MAGIRRPDRVGGDVALQAGEGAQKGALAGAVRPEQRRNLAGLEDEVHAVQDVDDPVAGADAAQLQDRVVDRVLGDNVTMVHVLPFSPFSSDASDGVP